MTGAIGIRCDAGVRSGLGHLVRCVALAEELCARGMEVRFLGNLAGSPWARTQLLERGLPLLPAPARPDRLAGLVRDLGLGAVVLDSYELPPGTGAAIRATGAAVLAIIDGDHLGQEADLYLDQNLGAELRPFPMFAERLAGARYVLLRDSVRDLRDLRGPAGYGAAAGRAAGYGAAAGRAAGDGAAGYGAAAGRAAGDGAAGDGAAGDGAAGYGAAAGRAAGDGAAADRGAGGKGAGDGPAGDRGAGDRGSVPRVLCCFGGTDSAGVAPAWTRALLDTGLPFRATVVTPRKFRADGPVTVIPPTDRLPQLMAEADLVVSAAGSTVWELLYLGVPTALTWVAANQLVGYEPLVRDGIAAGLGPRADAAAIEALARLLADAGLREKYGRRGSGLIDGRGRERVADALLTLR
ncbi:glycosyltransferase [Nonomuraea sp. NPDC048916]|uniref:PseG/SpsG family protein n=1 Tax=Nonomuraea sp. NPDC048916 TaxID=3154232 RepID=UPI0033FD42D7